MKIKLKTQFSAVERLTRGKLSTGRIRSLASSSLNVAGKRIQREAGRAMAKVAPVKLSAGSSALALSRARRARLSVTLAAKGKPLSLKHYKRVRVSGSRVSWPALNTRRSTHPAFQVKGLGGHYFKRLRDQRTPRAPRRKHGSGPRKDPRPIQKLFGPGFANALTFVDQPMLTHGTEVFMGDFIRRVNRAIRKR